MKSGYPTITKDSRGATRYAILLVVVCIFITSNVTAAVAQSPLDKTNRQLSLCNAAEPLPSGPVEDKMPDVELVAKIETDKSIIGFAWSPNSREIVTTEGFGDVVEIWDAKDGKLHKKLRKQPGSLSAPALFSPDGKSVIVPSTLPFDGVSRTALSVIDIETGETTHNVDGPGDPSHFPLANLPAHYILSQNRKDLFMTFNTPGNLVHIYDTSTWVETSVINTPALKMRGGPDDDELTTMSGDGVVSIWNLSKKEVIRKFRVMRSSPGSIALAPRTCRLAVGADAPGETLDRSTGKLVSNFDPTPIRLWNVQSGDQTAAAPAKQQIRSLAFSPDEALLAASDDSRRVLLFQLDRLDTPTVIKQFSDHTVDAKFSPDGRYLAAAGDDKVFVFRIN